MQGKMRLDFPLSRQRILPRVVVNQQGFDLSKRRREAEQVTKEEIGRILKQLRQKSGKTQQEVADLLGRKQQVIGHWETGYSQPDANTLFLLCDIYGANIDEAFGFKKTMLLNGKEQRLIDAYHRHPEMQRAVDVLLGIEEAD